MWFIGCENKVVVKTPPIENINNEISKISDYKTGVKGNCGMCKTTIEKAVLKVDGVEEADWGINSKILLQSLIFSKLSLICLIPSSVVNTGSFGIVIFWKVFWEISARFSLVQPRRMHPRRMHPVQRAIMDFRI